MSQIRGLIVQSRMEYLEKKLNAISYNQMIQNLPEPVRQTIGEQVFPTNLYPYQLLKELDSAIGEYLKQPLEIIFREMGRQFAASLLDRYFQNYIENKNPQKFLAQIANLYGFLWNFGQYHYSKSDNNKAQVKFEYDEDINKSYCWFMQDILKRGIEICGGKSSVIKEKTCEAENGESCIYVINWS